MQCSSPCFLIRLALDCQAHVPSGVPGILMLTPIFNLKFCFAHAFPSAVLFCLMPWQHGIQMLPHEHRATRLPWPCALQWQAATTLGSKDMYGVALHHAQNIRRKRKCVRTDLHDPFSLATLKCLLFSVITATNYEGLGFYYIENV